MNERKSYNEMSVDERYEYDRQRYIQMVRENNNVDPRQEAARRRRDRRESQSAGAQAARAMAKSNRARREAS
jgi:hypothetical protein